MPWAGSDLYALSKITASGAVLKLRTCNDYSRSGNQVDEFADGIRDRN